MVKYNLTCIGWVRLGLEGGGVGGGGVVQWIPLDRGYRYRILMGFDTMMHCVS